MPALALLPSVIANSLPTAFNVAAATVLDDEPLRVGAGAGAPTRSLRSSRRLSSSFSLRSRSRLIEPQSDSSDDDEWRDGALPSDSSDMKLLHLFVTLNTSSINRS